MKSKVHFTIFDIEEAYRKLKTHFYYDNTNHHMRRKIAEFEKDSDFTKKLESLLDDLNNYYKNKTFDINKYGEIGFYTQPKSFENNVVEEKDSLIVTNRYVSEQYNMKNFNFFIDIPVELHIINVLWIIKLGYLLDSQYCHYSNKEKSYCYANKLEINEETGNVITGNKLFKTYAYQYQQWRDNCIAVAEDLLQNHKKDVIIVSLDIKRYYPSAKLNYSLVNDDLKNRCINKDRLNDFSNYSFLTDILGKIRDKYYNSIKELIVKDNTEKNDDEKIVSDKPIPIGMLSSNIIANWYLRTFDEQVNQHVRPAFYGRYVDDILIVLENHGDCSELAKENSNCDQSCCVEKKKLTIHKVLKQYFCGCNKKECGLKILEEEAVKQVSEISQKEHKSKKFDYYVVINNNRLKIQGNKVKLFVFDADSTKAMLKKFKDTIKKHSSEFRFLPEEDRIQEDFVQETYSIDYNDTINKLRSIDKYQLDRFKISSYLAKQLMLAKYSKNNSNFNKTKEEILYAFSGRMGLELFAFWDKVLTYFMLNKDKEAFCEFSQKIINNIQRINYKQKDILEYIKVDLYIHLLESIYLSLSLNPQFIYIDDSSELINNEFLALERSFSSLSKKSKKFSNIFGKTYKTKIKTLLNSLMIKHKYSYMPILNYVPEISNNYVDLTNENIFTEFPNIEKVLDVNHYKLKFNPRYFSFEEVMLFENYKFISDINNINNQVNENLFDNIFENTINTYINLNYEQYNSEDKNTKKLKNKIEKYFQGLKKQYLNNYEQQENYIDLRSNKNNKPIRLSDFVIGLYNTKVSDESITKNLITPLVPTFDELQIFIRFLNLAIQNKNTKCNMIIFPEVCIPHQALGLLADFSKKHNVAIVCGLKHITIKNTVLNLIATILPFNIGNCTNSYINLRLKEWYSPAEIKEIKKYGKTIPYNHKTKGKANSNNLFVWNGLHFAVYDCFELADTNYRCEYKSLVDMIIACEWNKDLDYFNNIIKSAARDIHCYVTQVNTSQFGDSKVIAPKKSSEMTLLNIKGGEDNILIGKLNIEELRAFQRKETEYLEEKDKIFKPLPPAFQKETSRLTKNKI